MDHRPCRSTVCRLPSQPPTAMPHVWLRAPRRGHSGLRASPDRAVAPAEHRPSRRSVVRSSNRRVRSWFLPPIVAKKLVEFRVRYYAGKTIKLSLLGDFGCRLDGRRDLLAGLDAGRVEAIGAGVSKGLQPADSLVQVGPAAGKALGAGGEHDVAAGLVDRRARGLHAGEREIESVERLFRIAGRILDRQSGDAGRNATRHILGDAGRIVGKAALKVGIERHVGGRGDLAEVSENLIARLLAIGVALRMGVAQAGGRQRLEAEPLQIAGAADVPRIGDDEASGIMQAAEDVAFFGRRWVDHAKIPGKETGATVPRLRAPG